MKKIMVVVLLALSLSTITGCANSNLTEHENKRDDIIQDNASNNDIGDQTIEGGENGRIRGYYRFNNYEEFSFFYGCFKEHNVERYLVPNDKNKDFTFEYAFLSEGMLKSDFESKQYNITYPNQTMFLNLWFNNIEIKGTCFNVNVLQNISTLNLKYEIKECSNNTYELTLITEENNDVFKAIVKYSSETLKLNELCEKIVYEFERGVI